MTFRLVPEVLDPVDVISVFGKQFGMLDADMMEVWDIEDVIGPEVIRIKTILSGRILLFMIDSPHTIQPQIGQRHQPQNDEPTLAEYLQEAYFFVSC